MANKRLISRIYKELQKLNNNKIKQSSEEMGKQHEQNFSKAEIQMKECSESLVIREMKTKTNEISLYLS